MYAIWRNWLYFIKFCFFQIEVEAELVVYKLEEDLFNKYKSWAETSSKFDLCLSLIYPPSPVFDKLHAGPVITQSIELPAFYTCSAQYKTLPSCSTLNFGESESLFEFPSWVWILLVCLFAVVAVLFSNPFKVVFMMRAWWRAWRRRCSARRWSLARWRRQGSRWWRRHKEIDVVGRRRVGGQRGGAGGWGRRREGGQLGGRWRGQVGGAAVGQCVDGRGMVVDGVAGWRVGLAAGEVDALAL